MFNATYCSSYVYLEVKIIAGIDFPVQSNMITYSVWIYGTTHNPCLCMWSFMSSCELNKTYQYIFDSQLIAFMRAATFLLNKKGDATCECVENVV